MAAKFFGQIQGPFPANGEIFTLIQAQHSEQIKHLTKLGIHLLRNYDLDLNGRATHSLAVAINDESFQIGRTGMLEFDNVEVTSIVFPISMDATTFIDYQYEVE